MLPIRATATVYVQARVSAKESGAFVDLTSNTVSLAFAATDTAPAAASSDWKSATWTTDTTTDPDTYRAQCLVGPGGTVTLAVGTYHLFAKVSRGSEVAIHYSGIVEVTA